MRTGSTFPRRIHALIVWGDTRSLSATSSNVISLGTLSGITHLGFDFFAVTGRAWRNRNSSSARAAIKQRRPT